MPIFEYSGLDPTGRPVSGEVYGANLEAAVANLTGRGFRVDHMAAQFGDPPPARPEQPAAAPIGTPSIHESPSFAEQALPTDRRSVVATDILGPLVGKVSLASLTFFFRQLSAMLNAGVNPVEALDTLAGQCPSPKLREVIHEMSQFARAGRPMSESMQRYPEVFTPVVMSLVRAGEQGGFLDDVLGQISDYLDREIALRNLIRRATIYPKLVLAASIVIFIGANQVIKMLAPNSPIRLESPLTSLAVWLILGPLLIGLFLFLRVGLHNPRVRFNWDLFVSRIPMIGKTSREFAMAKFGRAFGALYRAGVPVHQAFRLAADACGNEYWRARMNPAFRELETGAPITETLAKTGAFTPIVMNMVATGERTGNLDETLLKMSEYYEGEAETRSIQMGWATGVVALLVVALYVGYLYIKNLSGIVNQTYQGVEFLFPR